MSKKSREHIETPDVCLERVKEAIERAKEDKLQAVRARRRTMMRMVAVSFICLLVILPNISIDAAQAMSGLPVVGDFFRVITIRDYHYIDDRFSADVRIPEISSENGVGSAASQAVNQKIRAIAQQWMDEFEEAHEEEWGRSEIIVDYEIISTAPEYFTLKLMTYQGAGSGYEQDHYFTIRIDDGKEMMLADLFPEGADYITTISENIKKQMRREMAQDSGKSYWIDLDDDDLIKAWEFDKISEDQSFYVDEEGRLVIAFNEGDAGPMYMGCIKFTIPKQVIDDIK